MTEPIPQRLSDALADRYELIRELGAGGMATVYLARDLKHERRVAVKVLRPELAAVIGGERFITEIKTTAALQHPHILPLFDSGEADSYLYYVMPYVDGESLRTRMDRERQLEVDEALHITKAVASALQYAHEHDIIHRDIKPENILLHAGEPVVADFGIALALSAAGGGRLTETGLSLGTPHYMSPEQAAADRDLSARSDVYSLACVLYEMLAGQPPHTGPTAQSILVRILTEDPRPVTDLRPTVPRHVRSVLSRALEKLPADRFKSAAEFRDALDDTTFTYERVARTGPPMGERTGPVPAADAAVAGGPKARTLGRFHAAATAALAVATVGLILARTPSGAAVGEGPLVSFVAADSARDIGDVAVGPDGTIVFTRDGRLWVRRPGSLEAEALEGVSEAGFPAISPDGAWVLFGVLENGAPTFRKMPVTGGATANVWSGTGLAILPTWGDDGWIYFSSGGAAPTRIERVPEIGGEAELVTETEAGFLVTPSPLPGGRGLLYTATNASAGQARVVLLDRETGDTTTLAASGATPRWSPTGHVLYVQPDGSLWALPFDADRLEATGPATPVAEGLRVSGPWVAWALSPSGTLAYVAGPAIAFGDGDGIWTFGLMSPDGALERLPVEATDHWDARLSPDGRVMAYTRGGDIWLFDLDRGSHVALTEGGTGQHNPIWSPDGTRIAYRSGDDMKVRPVDRSAEATPVTSTPEPDNPSDWLEDGTILVTTEGARAGDIYAVTIDSDAPPRELLAANWGERAGVVSPDGRWFAYSSARSGEPHLYVRTWPGLENETQISADGETLIAAFYPIWSADSGTIFYQTGTSEYRAVDVQAGATLRVAGRRTLPFRSAGYLQDSHPDGRLLVTLIRDGGSTSSEDASVPTRLVVATNWFTELKARLGRGS